MKQQTKNITLQTDIQTASQRIPLQSSCDSNEQAPFELKPDQSVSRVLHHEVKELGNHSWVENIPKKETLSVLPFFIFACSRLVCTVSCVDHNGEKHNLKKVFKLPVR